MFGSAASSLAGMIERNRVRENWLNSLPKEESDKIRAEDARVVNENLEHKRALEIANAGRPRNFWGN